VHIEQLQRLYFNTQKIRVPGVGNAFQKTVNDSYKGEREMSVCELQRNAVTAHKQFVLALKEYRQDVSIAKKRGVKLTREALSATQTEPISVGVGRVYCHFLAQLKIKELLAEEPQAPMQAKQDTSVKVPADTARITRHAPLKVDSHRAAPAPKAATWKVDSVPLSSAAQRAPSAGGIVRSFGKPAAPPSRGNPPALAQSGDTAPPGGGMAMPNEAIPGQVESARLRLTDALRNISAYEVEIQKKFALAAACFVLVLLGAPIALRFPRGGVGLTIGVSLVVFGLYYVGLIAGESLARRGMMPPVVSMWLANIVFGTIALILLTRMGRETGTSRGGDFGEMVDTIRQKLFRRPARGGRRVVIKRVEP
jgi:Predicted permeases